MKGRWLSLGLAVGILAGAAWSFSSKPSAAALEQILVTVVMSADGRMCTVKPKDSHPRRNMPCFVVASYLEDALHLPKGPAVELTANGVGLGNLPLELMQHGYQIGVFIRGPHYFETAVPAPPTPVKEGSAPRRERDCDGVPEPCAENPPRGISMYPDTNAIDGTQNDGPLGLDRVGVRALLLFDAKRFQDLDQLISRYAKLKDRIDDGRFKLDGISRFLVMAVDNRPSDRTRPAIDAWISADPKSPGAAILDAAYWRHEAWLARGSGDVNAVTPDARQSFDEHLEHARSSLSASEPYAARNPLWYGQMLNVNRELKMPRGQQEALFEHAYKAFPDYYPLSCDMLVSELPKWGGAKGAISQFIDSVVNRTPPARRSLLYTRLWWCADSSSEPNTNVFRDLGASWPRTKSGFESLDTSYPGSLWNEVNFASFACRAGDLNTYHRLRTEVGERIQWHAKTAFRANLPVEACDRQAGVK